MIVPSIAGYRKCSYIYSTAISSQPPFPFAHYHHWRSLLYSSQAIPLSPHSLLMTLAPVGLTSSSCLVYNKSKKLVMDPPFYYQSSFSGHFHRRVTLISSPKLSQQPKGIQNNGRPKAKKQVRFCSDDQLERVRFFLKNQEPIALREGDASCLSTVLKLKCHPNWPNNMSLESQPQRGVIRMESVEQVVTKTRRVTLMGQCRVANLAFQKHVAVRYTTNDWHSYQEAEAVYQEPILSCASPWDRFVFHIDLDDNKLASASISFALRYIVNGREYWDNNDGLNYLINVVVVSDHSDHMIDKKDRRTKTSTQGRHGNIPSKNLGLEGTMKTPTKERLAHRYNFGASLSAAKKALPIHKKHSNNSHEQQHHEGGSELKYRDIIARHCIYDHPTPTTTSLPSPGACPKPVCG